MPTRRVPRPRPPSRALLDAERAREVLAWRILTAAPGENVDDLVALLRAAEERITQLTFEGLRR